MFQYLLYRWASLAEAPLDCVLTHGELFDHGSKKSIPGIFLHMDLIFFPLPSQALGPDFNITSPSPQTKVTSGGK